MKSPLKVAVTGAAGQIGYALIFRIASGEMFGPSQPLILHLIEIPSVLVLVIGKPCNTNCLIAMNNAKEIPRDRWFAMTRLDENRARAQLAHKAGVEIARVTNMTIWGNHSSTQYPDFYNARIDNRPANEVIGDEKWLKEEFIATVQQRGAAVIKARSLSSAGSAANAIVDTVRFLKNDTPRDDWHSVAVCSDESYG